MLSRFVNRLSGTILVLALVAVLAGDASAQNPVTPGYLDVGAVAGIGETGDAGFSGGLRTEYGWRTLPSLGGGTLAIQAGGDFYWWSFGLGYKWFVLPLGVSANYHFKSSPGRFDPFVGVGFGYTIANCSWGPGIWGRCEGAESEFFPIAKVGTRIFLSDVMAFYVDAGLGSATVNAGLTFRVRGSN